MSRQTIRSLAIVLAVAGSAGVGAAFGFGVGESGTAARPVAGTTPSHAPADGNVLRQFSQAFRQAAEKVNPSVVAIKSETVVEAASFRPGPRGGVNPFEFFGFQMPNTPRRAEGFGSGVIVSPDGYVLTNAHVVKDATKLTVEVGGKSYSGRVVGTDELTDLAVVKIDAKDLPAASLGDSDDVQVGDWVIAVGNPLELRHSVTAGIVSARGRSDVGLAGYEDFIQTDASINPGNSGGALADLDGRVVGINTAIASPNGGNVGIGFAIPANMAKHVMDDLIRSGSVERAYLAIVPQDVDESLAAGLHLRDTRGALIGDVSKGGPADKAGLRSGDVIVAFDGKPVENAAALRATVAESKPGRTVPVRIVRNGSEKTVDVALGERPNDKQVADASSPADENDEAHRLGIAMRPLDAQIAQQLGVDADHGALVAAVEPGSAAEEAGLRPGDVIRSIGGNEINSPDDVRKAVRAAPKDGSLALLIQRGERTAWVGVQLG